MNKLAGFSIVSLLSLGMAHASLIPCTITGAGAGGAVSNSTVVVCGTLTFDDFQVLNPTGGAAGIVDILSGTEYDTTLGTAYLQFNPNLQNSEDEQFLFQVVGGINQIDMSVGGTNATITERACANPIQTSGPIADLCTNAAGNTTVPPLGQITVASNTPNQPVFSDPFTTTSPVYIFKDIQTGPGGALSEFTQSFETAGTSSTPEPLTLILLGSGLLMIGMLRRRTRNN